MRTRTSIDRGLVSSELDISHRLLPLYQQHETQEDLRRKSFETELLGSLVTSSVARLPKNV